MFEYILNTINEIVSLLPGATVHVMGFPIGLYSWELILLVLAGEVYVIFTNPKKVTR